MRIAQPASVLAYLPLYNALQGTDNELISFDGPSQALEAVAKNDADIAIGDPFLFNYVDYAEKNLVVAGGFIENVLHSLITFNPFIEKVSTQSLNKKSLVCYPEPSTSFFLANRLKEEFNLGNVIQTPFNAELGPLLTLEAEVAIVLEPTTTYALRNGARELLDFSNLHAGLTGFSTTKKFFKENNSELSSFFSRVQSGIHSFKTNSLLTMDIAQRFFPLVEEKILFESIKRLRKQAVYCENLTFSESVVAEGLKLRGVAMDFEKIKPFLAFTKLSVAHKSKSAESVSSKTGAG